VQIKTVRTKEELSPVLLSPEEKGPDFAYWVFSGVTRNNRWENMTVLTPGTYGQEFIKTFGHYHNDPHEETYRVVSGKGILLLQEKHFEGGSWTPNKVDRFIILSILPGDEIALARALGARLDARRVEPGVGLGDRETGALAALEQRRQHAPLLLGGAENHHGIQTENVHVHRGGAREARARLRDRLHHHGRLRDAEARAAELLRHRDAEPAVARQRLVQLGRKTPFLVVLQPVLVAELRAQLRHRLADALLLGRRREVHRASGCA